MQYRFTSMAALADYFEAKATDCRNKKSIRKVDYAKNNSEAFAWEQAAHVVRHSIINGSK